MSDPVITNYGGAFIYYTCDRDPTSSEPLILNNLDDFLMVWWNTSTNKLFWCMDDTADSLIWINAINANNLSASLNALGFSTPSSQFYTNVSLSFSADRTPSTTKNTFVIANISQTSVLLGSATVNALVGGTQIASAGLSGVAATQVNSLSFMVAPTVAYRLNQSVSGIGAANSIVSVKEFYL